MATITPVNPIDNNSANSGAALDANFDILKSNDDALNAAKAENTTVDARTTLQVGAGDFPAATPLKTSYFQGTTDSLGGCIISNPLGDNVIGLMAYIYDGGSWVMFFSNENCAIYFNTTQLVISINQAAYFTKPARFLVFHK